MKYHYQNREYTVIEPCSDNCKLADKHERLLFVRHPLKGLELVIAPKFTLFNGGYVIGLFD